MLKTMIKIFSYAFVAVFWCVNTYADVVSDFVSTKLKAYGVVVPFYNVNDHTPSVIVRADAVYTDHERKGFFRIGVLPLSVIEGVTFEIYRSESLKKSLEEIHNWITAGAVKRFEFRKLRVLNFDGRTNRLECGCARFVSDGKLELLDGVRFISNTNQLTAPRAILQISGENAGRFIMFIDPPYTNNLFECIESTKMKQKERP